MAFLNDMIRVARKERGQAMAEFALGAVAFFLAALGALHFALAVHARHVTETAAVEGARWAAVEPFDLGRGMERARTVLRQGLGRWADSYTVEGQDQGDTVLIRVSGRYIFALPFLGREDVPLTASAVVRKEGFRPGP
jgi:Flp pilus assembly protein TadG